MKCSTEEISLLSASLANLLLEDVRNTLLVRVQLRLLVLDLLDESLLIAHLRHHLIGLLQGLYERIYSLVELIQVLFHVFLLGLEVFGLFVRIVRDELLLETGLIIALDNRFIVGHGLVLLIIIPFHLLGARVEVLLNHELVASLQ